MVSLQAFAFLRGGRTGSMAGMRTGWRIQDIGGADLPALALVTIPTVAVQTPRVRRLVRSIDLAAGDRSQIWLAA